jgi:hypothetical protein
MFSKTCDPCDAFDRLHRHEASLARQHQAALRELRLSKDERSKVMTGKNPAASLDIAEVVEQMAKVLRSENIPFSAAADSNPIPGPSQSSGDPDGAEAAASAAPNPRVGGQN